MRITNNSYNIQFRYLNLVILLFITSCGVEKFIPEDERLYTGATLSMSSDTTIVNKDLLKNELEQVLMPEPNSKFLGMYVGLYYYYKNQKKHPGFINRWLYKNLGEEPVYQSDVEPHEVRDLLVNRLENRGFFYSTSGSQVNEKDKEASVDYTVNITSPYTMATYQLDSIPSPFYQEVKRSLEETPFKEGMRFDLGNFELERQRIERQLKLKGYFNFNNQFLIFEADTNRYKNKRYDLYLSLKSHVPNKALIPYKIAKVNVYSNYELNQDSLQIQTTRFNEKNYLEEQPFFKPKYLDPFILIKEGDYYHPEKSRNTARRLSSIGSYKYVNIQYKELDTLENDNLGLLQADIYLSPLNKRSLRTELQAVTKSNNFAGPALGVTYTNRNLFGGGESFSVGAKVGYEKQIASGSSSSLSSTQLGLETELLVPRMVFPIKFDNDYFEYAIPKTKIGFGIDYLNRTQLYALLSGNAKYGYVWNANRYVTHEINPVTITYTQLTNTTPEFEQILDDNPYLRESFEQEFIAGLTYSFTYNGMVDAANTHQFYFNTTFDMAGNIISLFGKEQEPGQPESFLGLEYAQYAKLDVDFHYHFNFGKEQKIATRLFAGYGLPYGNSNVLPFVKQYYAGGPYSVRAFRIRSLGPGTFHQETDNDDVYIDQSGNIRLEANIEYRFPIVSFLKGALFVDAGNIWNSKSNEILPGGTFSNNFYKELGMGAGVGTRVDVQGFVIRFDFATPFHDPSLPDGERYNFDVKDTIFNFAIGYPF
ncbi:translocation and assembly module lipoprotein TamL [Mangrovimonas futianensis]|uniref:translocation and assembly module lipoprotein TamL n=1 Tax=Mangrovimonas futianensis TaxID=2895523 RepID=UPI001E53E79F|nr:BamA/TamA family outer membrane protein [Mangrovimonas futianensis]MCF1423032.1 outer membrane protein assembly factor [Mangrovimonas futianensis]